MATLDHDMPLLLNTSRYSSSQNNNNRPAGLSELQTEEPWTSTSLPDHINCSGDNSEVKG